MESNGSPEIPDTGETSDIPGLPSGANCEGKERRAMTESKWEGVPGLYSRETERRTNMLFSFEGGDAKSSIIGRRAR